MAKKVDAYQTKANTSISSKIYKIKLEVRKKLRINVAMLGANPNRFKRGKSQCRGCGVTRTGISGTIMALSVQITDYRGKQ